jgi:hypothetical protein
VPAVVTQTVKLFDGFPPGTGLITVNDDHTFVLEKVDPSTNQPISTVISTPLSGLLARGSGTRLTFTAGTVKRSVDFSLASEFIRNDFGIAGDIAGGVLAGKSGIGSVVAALRNGGATVKYLTYWQRRALNWAIALGFIVVIILIIALVAVAQR